MRARVREREREIFYLASGRVGVEKEVEVEVGGPSVFSISIVRRTS